MSGGYTSEQDLRRRMARCGSSSPRYDDLHARLGHSSSSLYEARRRSGLREEVYADARSARREAREQQQAALEDQMQRQMQQQQERERRRAGRDEYGVYGGRSGRSSRRGAVTAANDEYLVYIQAAREQQQREHDKRPRNVQRYGRRYFPGL
jgi:hypothetical protein